MATNPNGLGDAASQIAAIKANSTKYANAAVRGVQGGFVVSGQMQYADNATKGVVLTENAEGVAQTEQQAAQMVLNYLRSGSFDAPVTLSAGDATAQQPAATI